MNTTTPRMPRIQKKRGLAKTKDYAERLKEKAIQQGWPESLMWFENNMPKEIQELANMMHADSLEKLGKIGVESYQRLVGSKGAGIFDGYGQEMVPQSSLQLGDYNPDEVEYAY